MLSSKKTDCKKPDLPDIKRKIVSTNKKIETLASSLALSKDSVAAKYIISEIEKLDFELDNLRRQELDAAALMRESRNQEKMAQARINDIRNLIENFDNFTAAERNDIVKTVVSECIWDGETLSLRL